MTADPPPAFNGNMTDDEMRGDMSSEEMHDDATTETEDEARDDEMGQESDAAPEEEDAPPEEEDAAVESDEADYHEEAHTFTFPGDEIRITTENVKRVFSVSSNGSRAIKRNQKNEHHAQKKVRKVKQKRAKTHYVRVNPLLLAYVFGIREYNINAIAHKEAKSWPDLLMPPSSVTNGASTQDVYGALVDEYSTLGDAVRAIILHKKGARNVKESLNIFMRGALKNYRKIDPSATWDEPINVTAAVIHAVVAAGPSGSKLAVSAIMRGGNITPGVTGKKRGAQGSAVKGRGSSSKRPRCKTASETVRMALFSRDEAELVKRLLR